jgi:hypothetical protein
VTASLLDSLIGLPERARRDLLAELTDAEAAALFFDWSFWARPNQLAPAGDWRIWLLLAGRGFGKTRIGAEWVREQIQEYPYVNLIGATSDDARDIMIEGESGILAVCPPDERPTFRRSLQRLDWPNGAKSLVFTAKEPDRLRGKQHMRVWADEVASWPYVDDAWNHMILGLRLGADPRVVATSTPKPIPLLRELLEDPNCVITKGRTDDNADNLAPAFIEELVKKYRGTRLGRQELDAELLLDEGLAYRLIQGTHIVPAFKLPDSFARFESYDYGTNNPLWLAHATDYEGNVITFGLEDEPGLISEQAARITKRRLEWWAKAANGQLIVATCYAPPDIKGHAIKRDVKGNEITAEHEFNQHGIYFATAQNDRRAGYQRISEMLKPDPERIFPDWHPRSGEKGAPRAYILDTDELAPLVKNLRDAPIESPESSHARFPGEAVDEDWEHEHGHAHAAYRYGLMSRPSAAKEPEKLAGSPEELRAQAVATRLDRIAKRERDDLVDA